ncbi:MAG: dolichyl-phosphate beta-glucosyltransferase [Myxococcales bacterium]|nr:glycosyltransferase family 2 protein [Myxococcales bacterium]HIK83796.1 glycosyltransferase family 2 protein [Myxococcales bacterium]
MTKEHSGQPPGATAGGSGVFLSVVIPAYNEERRLPASFEQILRFLDGQSYRAEILVVENGSTDTTWDVANAAAERDPRIRVLREPIRGKGAAVRRGMLAAKGEYRFLCDADLSMPIEEVQNFLPPVLEHVDIAIGSREAEGAVRYEEPGIRHLMGRVFNTLVRVALVPEVQDTQCGFKCFRAEVANEIFGRVTRTGFSFDVESLVIANRFGYRIEQIPVHWHFDSDSRVRVIQDTLGTVFDVLVIWLKALRGVYDPDRSN